MKDANFVKQDDGNATTFSFHHFRSKFDEQSRYVAPLYVSAGGPSKDQVESALVLPLHTKIVPLKGTATAQITLKGTVEDVPFPLLRAPTAIAPRILAVWSPCP